MTSTASDGRSTHDAAETLALLDTLQATAPVGFMFVDREFRCVRVNALVAAIHGSASVEEHLGRTVAEVVPSLWAQLEPIYRRVLQSGVPVVNLELSSETADDRAHPRYWTESIYPVRVGGEIIGLGIVLVDVTERTEHEHDLVALTEATVDAIAAAAEAGDLYTAGHQRRVSDLSVAIATEIGMDPDDIECVRLAARIHDIGKLSVPSGILTRPSALTAREMALVQEHPKAGCEIIRGISFPWPIAEMILQHHERSDGSGYPSGLVGDEILLGARIIAVADLVEAMVSHRPYRASQDLTAALSQLEHDRGTLFDTAVVDACLGLFRENRFTFGEHGDEEAAKIDQSRDFATPRQFDIRGITQLSKRELAIAHMIVSGDRIHAIADRLVLSQNTVRHHLSSIYRKLGIVSQRELVERFGGTRGSTSTQASDRK